MAAPTLTASTGQAWRGALARRRCRYLRAAYTIMACYKRHKVRAYLRELLRRFQAVRTLPDFGKSVVWPEPPAVLAHFQDASQRLFRRYHLKSCSVPVLEWGCGDGNGDVGLGIWDGNVGWECGTGTQDEECGMEMLDGVMG